MWQIACSGETIGDYEGGILIRWIQEQIGHLLHIIVIQSA